MDATRSCPDAAAEPAAIAPALLDWYDRHRRVLPWRALPGETADPYRVWLSEVMLQQTTVAAVRPRFAAWTARWPDFASLAAADEAEVMAAWAGLGYYARARNLVAAAKVVVAEHGGAFPSDEATLRTLPGLGAYTAAAVAAIAFGRRAVVVDANVERVVARLFAIAEPLPAARVAIRAAADRVTPAARAGDFAQAMMDLGSAICTPKTPSCLLCPLAARCRGFRDGAPERLPVKAAKKAKPQRHGTIFWLQRGQAVLLERRPDKGLLGGMRALPTGPWVDRPPGLEGAPAAADWRLRNATVSHGFTHFDLELSLAVAETDAHHDGDGLWWPIAELDRAGLPTLFAKAAAAVTRRDE
ncbi:A/G-specific adenine glycosylase [Sphingomonas sp. A2-49]|uniref:A/G-specific adenine glycosylase n=1 Tax=Sphingomonas sp. A2-49 TaxID=1391375 RepID=UPI0021CF924C|nr:A/G-specific adenine glycosylase [Sphingomonas sp. A2-49]MCU6454273.1 A/G-specific adenine glycosylase [Sphingomonas sp. A2-49]